MNNLRVTLVQAFLHWESRDENLANFTRLLAAVGSTDVIVLPEMFSTGFSMQPLKLAETPSGPTTEWMQNLASEKNCVVTGSIITRENDNFYNRLIWMGPDGNFEHYDKKHLFSFAQEHDHYSPGTKRLVTKWRGWRICPMVCYDLRFPVWGRNHPLEGGQVDFVYDLMLFVANWPKARGKPWKNLLEARAHENQAYVLGVNRIGKDGNGIDHSGDSGVYSPKGDLLSNLKPSVEGVETIELNWLELMEFREKFTPWRDKDDFRLL